MKKKQRIFAFHLLNDRSGSPKVLSQLLRHWVQSGKEIHLYTSPLPDGFLSNIEGIYYHDGWYIFKSNPWLRLLYYSLSQLILMLKIYRYIRKTDIVYINTILPFGAALTGKLKGARVIYHIHESSVKPGILKWFLFKIVQCTASDIINVSKYVKQAHGITTIPNHLVYNSIEETYLRQVIPKKPAERPQNVLMVCSLKKYKGVFEFLQLASDHPKYSFRMVLNATQNEIDLFFKDHIVPSNIMIYASQKVLHPHYLWANIIANLSRPDEWIETFGLTIIEGMAYGLPAIVPPVGGILEVIEEGVTGFAVDSRNREMLNTTFNEILENQELYLQLSGNAEKRLGLFRESQMKKKIDRILNLI